MKFLRKLMALMAAPLVLFALWLLLGSQMHTYLIIAEPKAVAIRLNGAPQELYESNSFILKKMWGTHEIEVEFPSGRCVVEVYPRMSDDNSSSLTITPRGATGAGDLQYRVLRTVR